METAKMPHLIHPLCPEWIKKMWYLYTTEFYSVKKKNEIVLFAGK
jgi:hypothetical protein